MIKATEVVDTLKKHILVDGFHHVMDFEKSHGSWLVDKANGKEYLDCFGQFASLALGYNHPALLKNKDRLVNAAMCKIVNSDLYSEEYASFVDKFFKVALPSYFKYSFYIEGGAAAVDNALKVAFDWKAKRMGYKADSNSMPYNFRVIHLKEAFHGRLGYSLSTLGTGVIKTGLFPKFDWIGVDTPKIHSDKDIDKLENSSLKQVESAFKWSNIAAIIIEPIQSEGGNNMFRKEYFQALRQLADKNNCLLIFDEVQTGLGASGKWWCHEHYDVQPDIMVFGKKMQVCGIVATDKLDSVPDHCFKQSGRINSTWGGNIVDMVRAEIILDTIVEENLIKQTAEVGDLLKDELSYLALKYPKMSNVRGVGTLLAFDLPTVKERDEMLTKLREKMMVLGCGEKSIRLRPALTFNRDDALTAIEIFKQALS